MISNLNAAPLCIKIQRHSNRLKAEDRVYTEAQHNSKIWAGVKGKRALSTYTEFDADHRLRGKKAVRCPKQKYRLPS